MSLLSSLFRTKKVNLTPDIRRPTQDELEFTPQLRQFAKSRIAGENLGFGDGFVDKATSAPIKSREARFRDYEMPQISSQLSSRGLARSAGPNLATDVISRATSQKERDINDLVSQFFVLNEGQKKTDQSQALNLAQNMNVQQAGMKENEAAASERLVNATAADARARETRDTGLAGNILQAGAQLVAGPSGMALGGGVTNLLNGMGLGDFAKSLSPVGEGVNAMATQQNNIGVNTLDDDQYAQLAQLIKSMGIM